MKRKRTQLQDLYKLHPRRKQHTSQDDVEVHPNSATQQRALLVLPSTQKTRSVHSLPLTQPETTSETPKKKRAYHRHQLKKIATPDPQKKYKPQYRSNIFAVIRLFDKIKLKKHHKAVLKQTPFWKFFKSVIKKRYGDSHRTKKNEQDVADIIQCYDPIKKAFRIGGKDMVLTSRDISLIFGIVQGSEPITTKSKSTKATQTNSRLFKNVSMEITKTVIEEEIEKALNGKTNQDFEDVAKLLCLHALVTVFFCSTTHILPKAYIQYVDDIQEMAKYAWCDAIREKLMLSIENKHTTPEAVHGCVIALLYWYCEHTSILKQDSTNAFPRYTKWHLQKLATKMYEQPIHTLTANEVFENELQMTQIEIRKLGQPNLANQMSQNVVSATPLDSVLITNQQTDSLATPQTQPHNSTEQGGSDIMVNQHSPILDETEHQSCQESQFQTPCQESRIVNQTILSPEDNSNLNTLCQTILNSENLFHTVDDTETVTETILANIQQDMDREKIFGDLEDYISLETSTDSLGLCAHQASVHKQQIKLLQTERKQMAEKIQQQNTSMKEMETKYHKLLAENKELKEKYHRVLKSNNELTNQFEGMKQQMNNNAEQYRNMKNKSEDSIRRLKTVLEENNEIKEQMKKMKQQMNKMLRNIKT